MKLRNKISGISILIYLILMLIDRVVYKIPDIIYITITLILIVIIIIGFIIDNRR